MSDKINHDNTPERFRTKPSVPPFEPQRPAPNLPPKLKSVSPSIPPDSSVGRLNNSLSPDSKRAQSAYQEVIEQEKRRREELEARDLEAHKRQWEEEAKQGRRSFLKRTVATVIGLPLVDSILAHIPPSVQGRVGFSRDFWEKVETGTLRESSEQLRKHIEEEFNIKLIGPVSGTKQINGGPEGVFTLVDWDNPQLALLGETLSKLPRVFVKPRVIKGQPKPVLVALYDKGFLETRQHSAYIQDLSNEDSTPLVVFDKAHLGATIGAQDAAKKAIIHEFTHYRTADDRSKYIRTVTQPVGIRTDDDLREIFKSEVVIKDRKIIEVKSKLGHGALSVGEFLSIVAEYYTEGRDKFTEVYKPFLGGRTEILYERMRQEVFEGREY